MSLLTEMLVDSPSLLLKLDETSGTTAVDYSGLARNGTYNGSYTLGQSLGPMTGVDLSGGYIEVPDNAAFSSHAGSSGQMTVECWIVPDVVTASASMIVSKGNSNQYEWDMRFNPSAGQIGAISGNVHLSNGAQAVMGTTGANYQATVGRFYQMVFTYNRATPLIAQYRNGLLMESSSAAANSTSDTGSALRIGNRQDNGGTYFDGKIAYVAYYPTELSAARIRAHYDAGRPNNPSNLSALINQVRSDNPTALWPLTDTGSTVVDLIAGRNLTRNGYASAPLTAQVLPGVLSSDTGQSGYHSRSYDAAFSPGSGDWSIEFWYKGPRVTISGYNSFEPIFARDSNSSGNGLIVYVTGTTSNAALYPAGSLRVWWGGTVLQGVKDIQDNALHHIVVQRTGSTVSFYVDNVLDVSTSTSATVTGGNNSIPTLYLGANEIGGSASASVDYQQYNPAAMIAYYVGSSLTATRRQAHYEAGIRAGVTVG